LFVPRKYKVASSFVAYVAETVEAVTYPASLLNELMFDGIADAVMYPASLLKELTSLGTVGI
jgi:hypothetical protein